VEDLLNIVEFVNVLSEDDLFEIALAVAFEARCRAVDSYFIATAKVTNSILITNDRIMADNAKSYLIEEFDSAVEEGYEITVKKELINKKWLNIRA